MKIHVKLFVLTLLLFGHSAFAKQEMADGLRSDGKIYVLVMMILIILAGFVAFLFMLDRKLNRIEKQIRDRDQTKR